MLQYTEGDQKVNGVNIHYYRSGDEKNKPIVLLHGASDNGLCWSPLAEWLSTKYAVIMPDAQGHGRSDRLTPDFKSGDPAAHIAGLLKQLKIDRPIIMGHSMGAGTTVSIAVKYPDLPKAIILEDPGWQELADNAKMTPEMKKYHEETTKRMTGYAAKTRAEILAEGHAQNPKWSQAELEPWATAKTQFDSNLFKYITPNNPTYREMVPKINCPTLLITSDNGIVKAETAQKAEKLWKSSYPFRWVQIMGAGHNIRREQFVKFKEVLSAFLEKL